MSLTHGGMGMRLSLGLALVCFAPVPLLFISEGEALFSLQSNEVSLYDWRAHHNQSYTSGVNRTETNAAVTRHRTLPVYGLIIHQRLH